jgi:hypothetical protein
VIISTVKNCFICNWIIQNSWLTCRLTKVKLTIEQARKAQRGSRGVALLLLNLGARWMWVVSAMPWLLYPMERDPVPIG